MERRGMHSSSLSSCRSKLEGDSIKRCGRAGTHCNVQRWKKNGGYKVCICATGGRELIGKRGEET